MFLAQNIRLAKIADTIISFVTVAIMFLLGSLTL